MAGDWIPATIDLPRKREVLTLARITKKNRREVVGILFEFWAWVSNETDTGVINGITIEQLPDIISGVSLDFWKAMASESVGWLQGTPTGIIVPNADRWLTKAAKARLKEARRKQKQRGHLVLVPGS